MNCIKCGAELEQGTRFCTSCGAEQPLDQEFTATQATEPVEENKPAKVWKVFSIIGKIVGIVAICLCWMPYETIPLGLIAIVFSCLGKKYHTEETDKNFKIGLILGIIAVVASFFVGIIVNIVIAVIGSAEGIVGTQIIRIVFERIVEFFHNLIEGATDSQVFLR